MKNKKDLIIKTLMAAFLSFQALFAKALVTFTGTVFDESGPPLPCVNVLLLNPSDTSMVKGGITDGSGKYLLEGISSGSYLLSVSMLMINDKMVGLPMDAVVVMLDGMSAANIDQIELITTPPAKYEAEGDAGIINIKTIEHTDMDYNGSVGGNLNYSCAETIGGHLDFIRRRTKLAWFVKYSIIQCSLLAIRYSQRVFGSTSLIIPSFSFRVRCGKSRTVS